MTEKRFIVVDVPYENGEPFLYKKMLDKNTKKEYNNTLKGIDDMCDLANKLHEENEQLKREYQKLKHRIAELELLNDGLNYALKNIRKIDVEVDIG